MKHPQRMNRIRGHTNGWLVGCLSVLALAAIAGVVVFFIFKSVVNDYMDTYTSTEMTVFPPPAMTAEEARPLIDDFEAFKTAIENREAPDAFSLTGDEINALIQYDDTFTPMAGMAHVDIEGDQLYADVSVPLGMITDRLEGQYLNGTALIHIEMRDGRLQLTLDQLKVKDQPIPEDIMNQIRTVNLGGKAEDNPEVRRVLRLIESITVEKGHLMILPKPLDM